MHVRIYFAHFKGRNGTIFCAFSLASTEYSMTAQMKWIQFMLLTNTLWYICWKQLYFYYQCKTQSLPTILTIKERCGFSIKSLYINYEHADCKFTKLLSLVSVISLCWTRAKYFPLRPSHSVDDESCNAWLFVPVHTYGPKFDEKQTL